MRYDPSRGYQHPVLGQRDYHYRDGCIFEANLKIQEGSTTELRFHLEFTCNVESIKNLIVARKAVCAAWVYCNYTAYRQLFRADTEHWQMIVTIPGQDLYNRVEVCPLIVAVKDLKLPVHDAHEAFGRGSVDLKAGCPLAVDKRWWIPVDMTPGSDPTDIFQLKKEEGVEGEILAGAWDLRPDDNGGITLVADADTYQYFQEQKVQAEGQACPITMTMGLGLPAFVEALTIYVKDLHYDDDREDSDWRATINQLLGSAGVEVKEGEFKRDGMTRSALWVAQLLLKEGNPLRPLQRTG